MDVLAGLIFQPVTMRVPPSGSFPIRFVSLWMFDDIAAIPMMVLMAITSGVRIGDSTVWIGNEKTREAGLGSTSRAMVSTGLV